MYLPLFFPLFSENLSCSKFLGFLTLAMTIHFGFEQAMELIREGNPHSGATLFYYMGLLALFTLLLAAVNGFRKKSPKEC